MSGSYKPAGRDERPAPVVFHAGILVPSELTAELAQALEEYALLLRGTPLPAGRRGACLSRPAVAVLLASREAAAQHQAREHALQAWAAPTPVTDGVLGTAQPSAESDTQEITTSRAAELYGYSPEWWRRLAVRSSIRGRQVERGTWLLHRSDVVHYATRRPQESSRAAHSDPHPTGPERQAC